MKTRPFDLTKVLEVECDRTKASIWRNTYHEISKSLKTDNKSHKTRDISPKRSISHKIPHTLYVSAMLDVNYILILSDPDFFDVAQTLHHHSVAPPRDARATPSQDACATMGMLFGFLL